VVTKNRFDEPVITLVEAAGWLEKRFGRRPNAATIWRWAVKGLRGARLHTISLGRYRYTTELALERFITDTSLSDDDRRSSSHATETAGIRGDANFTEKELAAVRLRREAAKEKAKEFLRQNLGPSRPARVKRV